MGAETQKTILLVEDEAITAMAEKSALEKYGYAVVHAHSGEEAVALVEKKPGVDLILMDINLGDGMDGTEAAALILRQRDLPIVFLSSHMEPEIVEKTEKITSYGYVVKDSSVTVLDASIKMAFKLFQAKVNENKKEEELKRRNQYIESILDNMPIGFAVNTIDDGVVRYVNDKFTEIYGWPREVLTDVDRFFENVYPGEYGTELKVRVIRDMGSGDPKRMAWDDLRITTGSGDHRYISARNIPILEQNLMVSTVWDTTRMHESLEALRDAEARYRLLYEQSPDGIIIIDPATARILEFNEKAHKQLGYSREEFARLSIHDIEAVETLEETQARISSVIEKGASDFETRQRTKQGEIRNIRVIAQFTDVQGRPIYHCIWRDITGLKQAEVALRESEERLRDIIFSMADWVWEVDANGVYTYSSEKGQDFFGTSRGDILGKTPFDFMPADEAERVAAIFAEIMAVKAPIRDLENWNIGRDGERICLLTNGMPILDKDGNFKGYRGVDKDITEYKKVQLQREAALTALLESENKYRELVENHNDVIFSVDAAGRVHYVSPAITRITGYTQEEVTGKNLFDFFGPEEHDQYAAQMRQTMESGSSIGEFLITVKDRSSKWIRASSKSVVENGKIIGVHGIMSDITDHWQAEKEKEQIISLQRATLESTTDGILVISESGRITDFNQRFARMWRIPDSVLAEGDDAKTLRYVLDQLLDPQEFLAKVNELYAAPEKESFDQLQFKDGRCFERYSRPQMISGKPVGRVWSFRDISERKRAEEALRQSEAKQSNALQMTKSGHWEYDVDRDLFTFNDNFYRIFRTTAAAVGGYQMASQDYARRFCHPDDMAQVGMETRAAIEATDPNYSRQIEHRILYADGEVGWIAVRFFIVKDAQGRTIKTYGVNQDINERKRAEQELRESKSLIDAVVENVPLMIFLKEATDLRFVIFNHAGEELLGYDRSSLLGKNNLDLFPADQAAFFMAKDREVLDGEAGILDIPEESILTAKKGTRLLHTRKVCIQGADGTKKYLLGVSEDITERKLMESQREAALMELKVSEARSQALLSAIPDMLFRVNRRGVFLDYKADVKDLYAQSESSIIGKRYRDILPAEFADLIDLKVRATLETRVPQTFKYSLPVPGRGERDYEARMVVSGSDEVTAIIRDISEYDLVEKALRKSELQLKTMLDNSPVVVLLIQEGKLIYINPAAEKFTGWKMEELLGKSFTSVVYKDDVATVIKKNRERMDGENLLAPYMVRINKKTGGFIYAEVNGTVIDLDGKPTMLGFLTDITKRKRAEEEIQRQLEEKEVLLKEVHHRIKNNIASISGLISLQMQTLSNPQAIAILRDAIGRVDNMRLLYDKLLLTENYEDLSVKNYLDNLIDTIVAIFPSPVMIKLEKQIADFHLDAKRLFPLGSIINELLTNIMKYAFDDRKTGLIKISLAKVDHHITLAIQDNGRGLPPGFDFDKAKGFGLMLVKMLSQQLGGSFSMEKRKGTRCTLEFDV